MNAKERYNIFDEFAIANNYHFENDCKNLIDIILNPFCKLNKGQVKAIDAAQKHYYKFMKV
jgi:hypothetical protein